MEANETHKSRLLNLINKWSGLGFSHMIYGVHDLMIHSSSNAMSAETSIYILGFNK